MYLQQRGTAMKAEAEQISIIPQTQVKGVKYFKY